MKKGLGCGLTASLFLTILGFAGCSDSSASHQDSHHARENARVVPNVTVSHETVSDSMPKESEVKAIDEGPSGEVDVACKDDAGCSVIPTNNGCIPCYEGAGQQASSTSYSHKVRESIKNRCLPVVEALVKSKQQPKHSDDASCKFNGAKCISGTCELAHLSDAELQALMPKDAKGPRGGAQREIPAGNPGFGRGGDRQGARDQGGMPPLGYDDRRGYDAGLQGGPQGSWGEHGQGGHHRMGK